MTERKTLVKVGQHAVGGEGDTLITLGLGSCVALLLHDPEAKVGAMAHVLLPDPSSSRDPSNPAKFATSAVPLLLKSLERLGADRRRMEAKLVGGASMFSALVPKRTPTMGTRNVSAARGALDAAGIPVTAEDLGGDHGRSVRFDPGSGRVRVTSVRHDDVAL